MSSSSFNPINHLQALAVLLAVAAAWVIGKDGVPAVWAGIKSVYSWIRGKFSGTSTTTTTQTATPVA